MEFSGKINSQELSFAVIESTFWKLKQFAIVTLNRQQTYFTYNVHWKSYDIHPSPIIPTPQVLVAHFFSQS